MTGSALGTRHRGAIGREAQSAQRAGTSCRAASSPRARVARGFSLLETIAAILLLAMAVAALMRVASASLQLADKAGQTARADMLAQGKLDGLGIAEPLLPGESGGNFDRDYRWRLRIAPWHGDGLPKDGMLDLYLVDLRVQWGDAKRPRELTYVTLRTVPREPR